ncbi:MAG: SGNH/GDSL hydrolase family protein [Methylococcales bacterium]
MLRTQVPRAARRLIDFSLLAVIAVTLAIFFHGGYHGEIFGFAVSANTPAGPVKWLFLLLLIRAFLVFKIADFLVLAVSIIVSMLLAEVILRFWDAPITKFQLAQIHRPSPTLQWDLIPASSAVANTGATYRINSKSCRDSEYPSTKPAGVLRILALGDSFTFGMGVEAQDTYPDQLEGILNEEGYSVEVINCAVIGYDMWQHKVALKEKSRIYHPDLVTLGIFVNDLARPYPPRGMNKPGYTGSNPFAKHGTRVWLHKSYLYNTLRNTEDLLKFRFRARLGAKHLQGIAERKLIWGPSHPENPLYQLLAGTANPKLYSEFKTSLAEFVSIASQNGAEVLLFLLPDSVQLHDPSMQFLNKFIAEAAGNSNISYLDLTPVLENQDNPESLYLFPDDAHNSPKGLRIIAEAISNTLERSDRLREYRRSGGIVSWEATRLSVPTGF